MRCLIRSLEPILLPEYQAGGLTSAVRLAVASQIFEVYSSFELHAPGYVDGIACLVGALDDTEPLAAELQHLRHEGKVLEPPPSVAVAMGTIPAAIAAADPPLDPPGLQSSAHGLRVTPNRRFAV